ncbi:hypothetical protein LguiB_018360 [Lonicera macranthoides]
MLELLVSTAALNNETLLLSKRNTIQLAYGEIDQIEAAPMPMLDYLIMITQLVVSLKNGNSFAALDMIEQMPRNSQTTKMCEVLVSIGALNNETLFLSKPNTIQLAHRKIDLIEATPVPVSIVVSKSSLRSNDLKGKTVNLFKNNRTAILVAATVIANMAFQA